jgi:hypothetical protein
MLVLLLACTKTPDAQPLLPGSTAQAHSESAVDTASPVGLTPLDCRISGSAGAVWLGETEPVPVFLWEWTGLRWVQPTGLEFLSAETRFVWRAVEGEGGSSCLAWRL